ncbi:MAG: aminoacyl-tRNA hydrolase [Rickettsiales bacterium]|jgi:PTH1 family peptidyl-tRNA hydrolase|nr:aminoacyl-tRNA hydrolase [Rickettsiales bacterium]
MNHIIIAGLGNPGPSYEGTRHNVGFKIIDAIAEEFSFPNFSNKFSSLTSNKILESHKITLLKPQTFMNLSGDAISKATHFYKTSPDNLVVIHDDLDLTLAKVKMKIGGGSGGHNGIKSIDQHIGPNYYRLRIGINKPIHQKNISNFVLNKFAKEEEIIIQEMIGKILENFDLIIKKDPPNFMNKMTNKN